jgi:hypothetical protein
MAHFRRKNVELRVESRVREGEETIVSEPHRIKQIMLGDDGERVLSLGLKVTSKLVS